MSNNSSYKSQNKVKDLLMSVSKSTAQEDIFDKLEESMRVSSTQNFTRAGSPMDHALYASALNFRSTIDAETLKL